MAAGDSDAGRPVLGETGHVEVAHHHPDRRLVEQRVVGHQVAGAQQRQLRHRGHRLVGVGVGVALAREVLQHGQHARLRAGPRAYAPALAVTTSEVSPKDRSPIPPALPTSTTGASTMLMPKPADVGPAIGGRRLDRLDRLPGQGRRAGQLAEHPLQRLHAAALVVHRHEEGQVVAERGHQRAVVPDRGAAAHEHAAGPCRALEQRERGVGVVAVDADHEGHGEPRPQRQLLGRRRAGPRGWAPAGRRSRRPHRHRRRLTHQGSAMRRVSTTTSTIRRRRYTSGRRRRGARAPTATRRRPGPCRP